MNGSEEHIDLPHTHLCSSGLWLVFLYSLDLGFKIQKVLLLHCGKNMFLCRIQLFLAHLNKEINTVLNRSLSMYQE